jgi:hypothetical protein
MSDVSKEIKVTDKRMFTAEGELREEFRFLERPPGEPAEAPSPAGPAIPEAASPEPPRPVAPAPEPPRREAAPPPDASARLELPGTPPELGGPSFYDLAAMVAEPVAIYLGDIELPEGGTAEDLELARLHIDLLDLLRQKTAGNLAAQESAFLEDLLYRLRVRYVQKRG